MTNLNGNEKVLKFKYLGNKSYEVDVNDDDRVFDIKRKLLKKTREYKNIVLVFKNEILYDHKFISDYKIESNDFVLCLDREDRVRCISIIDCCTESIYLYNMDRRSTVRMLKTILARKIGINEEHLSLEFNYIELTNNATLEQPGLRDGCMIELIHNDIIEVRIENKFLDQSRQIPKRNLRMISRVGLLEQICVEKSGFSVSEILLPFNGECFSADDGTFNRCGFRGGCEIHLVNGHFIELCIKCSGRTYVYENDFYKVEKLKQLVEENGAWENIKLLFDDVIMCDYERLNYYGIWDGDRLVWAIFIVSVGCPLYIASLSDRCESFEITNANCLDDLITEISTKCGTGHSSINLYSDTDKINEIRNDQELQELYETDLRGNQITIYYEIISQLDEFQMNGLLGKGSYGVVYKCRNKNTNEFFAMKKFFLFSDVSEKVNFQREIDCYLKLRSHSRIIKYEKHFIENHKSYILMEYMDRGSLRSYVIKSDLLSEHRIAKYARQILEGLEYLHCNRILHRDLKGDNILLNEKDDLKLCDFGLAKILTSADFLNGVVPSRSTTLNFMSPEMIIKKECEPCGSPSDIWSFGATMVEIITRKYPHQGLAMGEIVSNIQAGQIIFEYPANSSNDIKSFINSCLKRNPKERANIKDLYRSSFLKSNSN